MAAAAVAILTAIPGLGPIIKEPLSKMSSTALTLISVAFYTFIAISVIIFILILWLFIRWVTSGGDEEFKIFGGMSKHPPFKQISNTPPIRKLEQFNIRKKLNAFNPLAYKKTRSGDLIRIK